ncbi:lycopene cyclase family protein [Aldersonia sp. NBC_00410]|uniref:lycopene cyclase family protein n=1 Tax=Aldersonia sp. NBC_00410 TaxID=2975954 RepID=UPI002258C8D9|nr:lycopene cyclase family protein [Aldersonia sp. NBC_00410]MCX5043999.1 lycopene cyclase family protein [Aldersonia sp. NBC_00410]
MSTGDVEVDVCVVGLGPTGRGLAARCLARGLSVAAVDPHPDRPWVPTYSCWVDELPDWLPPSVIASRVAAPTVWTTIEHRIERPYAVMSKTELWKALPTAGARVVAQKAAQVGAHRVEVADGTAITAAVVFDCRGLPPVGTRPAASAHGIFIAAERVADYVAPDEALLLDWRNENDAAPDAPPSFLYSVPIGDGTVIFEETTLGIPGGLTQRELRRRLIARLRTHGIELDGSEHSESCHYPLDQPPPRRHGHKREPIPFGSRGGMMHPCTGYSVADSLALADTAVEAIVAGEDAVKQLWTPSARAVYWMRMRGLTGMGRLTTEQTVAMFDSFFTASPRGQRALLSAHDDAVALGAVLFNTVAHTWPFRWRFDLVGWTNRKRWAV